MTAGDETISLRPLNLRPGGGVNPFAGFAKGAGVNLKHLGLGGAVRDEKRKPRGEVVKYTREFLMKFAPVCTSVPSELQYSTLEVMLDPDDPEREAQKALLAKVAAEDADERDWRARAPAPAAPAATPQGNGQPAQPQAAAPQQRAAAQEMPPQRVQREDPSAPKIQRASEIGKTAWSAGTTVEGTEQTMRKVKGILNKLTPEKFERLLSQLIPLINSYDILQGTITQVFENAVVQPTFVAMYADLCSELDAALPEYVPAPGGEPTSFRKMLANTCQEEYEATEAARAEARGLSGGEREDAERLAKGRLLGNVRLISELFKKEQVNDRIMLLILGDLLGRSGSDPPEDSVEAVCELLSIAGSTLEKNPRSRARLDAAFASLARMAAATKTYASRIRFVMREAIELRAQHWVARRETFTAKKLDEIRTEAQAELGIVDFAVPGLDLGGGLPGALPPLAPPRAEEVDLFPAFKSDNAGWAEMRRGEAAAPKAADGSNYSAFLGEFKPIVAAAPASNATPPEAPGQAPRAARLDLSEEQRESLGRSLFSDFLASPNMDEAVATAQELGAAGFPPRLVGVGLEKAFDALSEKEALALVELLAALVARGALTADDLRTGVQTFTESLEDISLDTPSAPKLLGRLLGAVVASGHLGLEEVARQAEPVESAEPRRNFVAAALEAVQEAGGDDALRAAWGAAKLDAAKLLASDPGFDGDLPDVPAFLKQRGLEAVL